MLKNVISPKKITSAETFNKKIAPLQERLGVLQRTFREKKIPVIIVVEGWDAAGITRSTKMVIRSLDPRGFTLHTIEQPSDSERERPFMWRFWIRMPPKGRIALFARSWYSRAISAEMQKPSWTKSLKGRIIAINNFERQLLMTGHLSSSSFCTSKKTSRSGALKTGKKTPSPRGLVTPELWNLHHHYDLSLPIIDNLLEKTDTEYAPWHVLDATDENYAVLNIYTTIIKTLEKTLSDRTARKFPGSADPGLPPKNPLQRSAGHKAPEKTCTKEECRPALDSLQTEMIRAQSLLFKRRIPLIIVFEGLDAAGKGGNITRIARYLNPRGTT